MTLNELIKLIETDYGAELSMLSCGVTILYSSFMNKSKAQVSDLIVIPSIVS
jgi:hypothetical protein